MKDSTIVVLVWCAIVAHIAVGVLTKWRRTDLPLLPLLNLIVALCVLGYWIPRWYSYIAKGITWYASDQLVPLYAVVVCVLSGVALTGRYRSAWPHWVVFAVDACALIVFAVFMSTFKMKRLF